MSELGAILLSAGIPDRDSDPTSIEAAIDALVTQTVHDRELVFGGHPAITPIVDRAARALNAQHHVYLYQSRWFEAQVPEAARTFEHLIWTEKRSTLAESLTVMRKEMIGSRSFAAAVLIGGGDGLIEECSIFEDLHPDRPIFAIASTSGAAQKLLDKTPQDETVRHALVTNKNYSELFQQILSLKNP